MFWKNEILDHSTLKSIASEQSTNQYNGTIRGLWNKQLISGEQNL